MRKNAILVLLLIAAVVAVLLVGIQSVQQKRSAVAGEQTTSEPNSNVTTASEITIEGLSEELKRVDDMKLDLVDPGLEFDVSF